MIVVCNAIKKTKIQKKLGSFLVGSQPTFGPSCASMVSTGVHLSMTGLSCLVFLIYSLEAKLRTLFLVASHLHSFH